MSERTHIGIESHKSHVWFDTEGDNTELCTQRQLEYAFILDWELVNKDKKQEKYTQHSAFGITSVWIINKSNWKYSSEAQGSKQKLFCGPINSKDCIFHKTDSYKLTFFLSDWILQQLPSSCAVLKGGLWNNLSLKMQL